MKPGHVVGPAAQRQREVAACAEHIVQLGEVCGSDGVRDIREKDRDQAIGTGGDIGPIENAPSLAATRLAGREQTGEARPSRPIGRVEQQRAPIGQGDARAWDHPHPGRLLAVPAAHDAGDAAPVGQAERSMTKQGGSREQFLGRAATAQEREMAGDLELDIRRHQPNDPCMYQLRSPVGVSTPSPRRNSQKRSPSLVSTRK